MSPSSLPSSGVDGSLPAFRLERSAHGHLVHVGADGTRSEPCVPVRAFPLSAPDAGLSLVGADGHELAWVPRLANLPAPMRALIEEELAGREFSPEILRIVAVSTFSTPSTWDVETDRGPTRLVLQVEEDIRRLAGSSLLIADERGVHFRIRDRFALDKGSRRLLERFL